MSKIVKGILLNRFSLIALMGVAYNSVSAQGIGGDTYFNSVDFDPKIKDALKVTEMPEINDTVIRLKEKIINIDSYQMPVHYQTEPIEAAKLVNEPLSKLYHCLLKAGFGNYTMPYGEVFLNNLRSKENVYGFHYRHLSSSATLDKLGYSGFSENDLNLYAKKFYKKHTLSGDFNYSRDVVHFYGYPDSINTEKYNSFIKQRFNLFDGLVQLKSHYTDSSKINHLVSVSYYNLGDFSNSFENNIRADADLRSYINKELLHIKLTADHYNFKSLSDTFNNTIIKINPNFEASGEKWRAEVGMNAAIDIFENRKTKFYFYPSVQLFYNVYNNIIIPYLGINGDLSKNSFRTISEANPFIVSSPHFFNTNNKYNAFLGLRGSLSNKTSYDVKVSYSKLNNAAFYLIKYDNVLSNRFYVKYDDANLLQVNGQLKFQEKEKLSIIAKGNYYGYSLDSGALAWHKPIFDLALTGNYNIKSKIIVKTDLYYFGNQNTLQLSTNAFTGVTTSSKKVLKGFADINLGLEYRYSKMLSFFVNVNNIGNFRYYRWDRYPTQRFNAMLGLTFVPF